MHMAGFALWRPSSKCEDNLSFIYEGNEDNDMHNEKWTLQNDFMRNLSSHHKVAARVADKHQV